MLVDGGEGGFEVGGGTEGDCGEGLEVFGGYGDGEGEEGLVGGER
jgi:hypothetical protein